MDILKAFSLVGDDYQVNIQGTHENPLFKAKDIANILELKNIRENLKDFSSDEKVVSLSYSLGGQQETIFLTEIGLYRLIGRSRKPIAQIFQRWIINVIKEIRINGMYKLNLENEVDKKLHEQKSIESLHQKLMKIYHNENMIYIFKLKEDPDKPGFFIIKIGSTQNIKKRIINISNDYNVKPILIDAFHNNNYVKTENMIHEHVIISQYKYHKIINVKNIKSREIYSVNNEIYENLLKIIEQINLNYCNEQNPEYKIKMAELNNENEKLKQETEKLKIQSENVILRQLEIQLEMKKLILQEPQHEQENEEQIEIDEIIEEPIEKVEINYIKKRANGIRVPKVYQYKIDDLVNPIHIFDSPSEAERILDNVSQSALKRASIENSIYKDYRWLYVNRAEEPPVQLEPTVEKKHSSAEIRFISMIDIKQTKILAVYASQKDAIEARNMKCNSFTRAIQQQSISSGHYWNFFDDCSEEMKQEYLKTNSLPNKMVSSSGIHIQKIDPLSKKVVCVYNSKRDIVKKYQISYLKLNQIVNDNNDEIYQGFIWRADSST
jgi:prophage antirepressor-like protein